MTQPSVIALKQPPFPTQAFINGEFVPAASGDTFDVHTPRDSSLLAHVAHCGAADVDRAVRAARAAFESGIWRNKSITERKAVLFNIANLLAEKGNEFAWLESTDTGKPLEFAATDDIGGAVGTLRWYAEAADKLYDEAISPAPGHIAHITREPIGVVGAVLPWNFPLSLLAWKLAPALMLGNSVIVKPSEKAPLTTIKFCEIAREAGLPEGVLNVLPGMGETTGQAIGRHPDIDSLTFTGSTATGKKFLCYAGESNMKRVTLECGGKSPNILLPDFGDLERFAEVSAAEIFYNQGEVCSALSRMIIPASRHNEVETLMVQAAQNWYPSDPLDPDCKMGAIIDETQFNRIMNYIEQAEKEGARLVCGGKQIEVVEGGYYVEPTIFSHVTPDMTLAQEEIFGPVLSIMTYKSEEEAVAIANNTIYGLAACLWTQDIDQYYKLSAQLKAGSITVNGTSMVSPYTPFGGFKQSGIGRDLSLHAFDKYSELKSTVVNLGC